jgi:hypothetical protein
MKRSLLVGLFVATLFGLPSTAMASAVDCFPLCTETVTKSIPFDATPAQVTLDPVYISAHRSVGVDAYPATSCDSSLTKTVDNLNTTTKPIREIVGYIRSPQGLAIKLVNDYVIKIPAWLGYAMDPLGSLKRKAIDEARTRAKESLAEGDACALEFAESPFDSAEVVDEKHSI